MPLTPDLSFTGLDEFVNKPVFENRKSDEEVSKVVRKSDDSPIIEDWVSDSEEENVSQTKTEKKTVKPSIAKIEFVKPKQQEKTARKTVKQGYPQMDLYEKGVIDSGCSRHMTGNMSYLIDYEEIDGGYVAFGGNPKGGKITGKGTKASDNAGQARKETKPVKEYILLPLWTADPPFSQDPKSYHDDGSKPLSDDGKKVDEDPRKDSEYKDQEKEDNVNNTNNVNAASTNEVNVVGAKTSIELPFDPNMPALEDISIFDFSRGDEDDDAETDMNNLDTTIQVSPNPTTRIHKDHPLDQVIGDLQSATQTRRMSKNLEEHGRTQKGNSCIKGSKLDRGYAGRASTIQATRSLDFSGFTKQKRAIGTKWVFRNKKDERGIVIRNKARLVAQGYTQEEGIDYNEVFASVARIEAIRLFLAYALFKDFVVYQMDVKSAFLYGKIEEEVYVCQSLGFEDPEFPDIMSSMGELTFFLGLQVQQKKDGIIISQDKYVGEILKKFGFTEVKTSSTPMETQKPLLKDEDGEEVDVNMYRSMIGSLMYLTSSRPDIMVAVCACARYQVNPNVSHLYAVKRIFRYLKGQPKLGLWYSKDSPFDLVAYNVSDYAGASLDRKSTTGGCQFLGSRLIS
ncbi:putative ribonuclease H-like domain-containing protein [Tanacetum coccineum]